MSLQASWGAPWLILHVWEQAKAPQEQSNQTHTSSCIIIAYCMDSQAEQMRPAQQPQRQDRKEIGRPHAWTKCRYPPCLAQAMSPCCNQEFVSTLPLQDLQKLVTAAYCNEGGLELARALLCDPPQDFPRDPGGNDSLPWCICHKCLAMDTSEENVCCRKTPCVTEMGWFDSVVLNRDVLSLAIEARSDIYADTPVYTPASYRKAAYHQYILWQHGYMGRNNRRVIPSCVVWCIRRKYPAPDGRYLGFREYREDDLI